MLFSLFARFRSFAAYLGAARQNRQLHRLNEVFFINYFPFFSSGVLDTSERDSNRKTRWNSAINEPDRTSASSSSEYSPVSTLRKSTKSRNEATLLFRFVGDINILVTPLILEALQRFVAKPLQFALFCFFLINSLWRLILTFCLPSKVNEAAAREEFETISFWTRILKCFNRQLLSQCSFCRYLWAGFAQCWSPWIFF